MIAQQQKNHCSIQDQKGKKYSGVNTNKTDKEKHSLHNHSSAEAELGVITGHTTIKNGNAMFGCTKTVHPQDRSFL